MSREEDDARQYQCLRKYEEIVKQLIDMIDTRTKPPKRRRVSSRSGGSSAAIGAPSQASIDQVFVQTITRFLHELNEKPTGPDSTPINPDSTQ